ncbi:MAG: hypothetical protein ABJF01_07810 [bacterium]
MSRFAPRLFALACMIAVGAASCSNDTAPSANPEPSILNLHPGPPSRWFLVGGAIPTYVVGVDNNTVHGGQAALAIAGTDTSRLRFNGVTQNIRADNYRGKRVRLRAWVRQVGVVGSDVGIWMRIDGPGVTQGFDNFSSRPLLGTSDWHQVEVILDIPDNAIGIAFGALMSASGEFFVDDMTFEVIPANGPTTNQLAGFIAAGDSASIASAYAASPTAPANLNFETR